MLPIEQLRVDLQLNVIATFQARRSTKSVVHKFDAIRCRRLIAQIRALDEVVEDAYDRGYLHAIKELYPKEGTE